MDPCPYYNASSGLADNDKWRYDDLYAAVSRLEAISIQWTVVLGAECERIPVASQIAFVFWGGTIVIFI